MNNGLVTREKEPARRSLAGALLILSMLVVHLLLMAHEPSHEGSHAAHGTAHGVAERAAMAPMAASIAMPDEPNAPWSLLGGCPVAQAALPGTFLLLLLALILSTRTGTLFLRLLRSGRQFLRAPPPPLAPNRRRALLQVFLI